VVELFAGIGGFRIGLEKANDKYKVVWSNDNDKYASAIYRYHWNDGTMHECDIRTVDAATIPDHDLLVGGFPCQSFSIAGKRGGFEDTRGTLFFEIARIVRAKRPSYLWLENVKGLLSHDEGNTFATIISTIDELGYDCQWQVLNSKNHGVPQNRERVFIIGHLRGTNRPQVFPFTDSDRQDNELQRGLVIGAITGRRGNSQSDGDYIVESKGQVQKGLDRKGFTDIAHSIDANYTKGLSKRAQCERTMIFVGGVMGDKNQMWLEDGKENSRNFPQGQRVYSPEGISAQLTAQGGRWGAKTGLYAIYDDYNSKFRKDGLSGTLTRNVGTETNRNGQKVVMVAQSLQTDGQLRSGTSWGTDKPQSARNIRRLTPIECERLQGFPDNWTKYGRTGDYEINSETHRKNKVNPNQIITISDSQRYKCCGNAVTTNVISDIAERLK
jgi:DNA (cytosine-5)-methyltransferase 1